MSNIVRIEDIINIVGMNNYFKAIQLEQQDIKLEKIVPKKTRVQLTFSYQNKHAITVEINKQMTLSEFKCNCCEYNFREYCPHVGLMVMHLLSHNDIVKQALEYFDDEYDEDFNSYLFKMLETPKAKKQANLEIKLKQIDHFEYELVLKIGTEKHTYVMKQKLEEFITQYEEEDFELTFGKNFTYKTEEYYFSEKDKEILNFVKKYVESQNPQSNYYYYSSKINSIKLQGSILNDFLKLLETRKFEFEQMYYSFKLNGIEPLKEIKSNIEMKGKMIVLNFDYKKLTPITYDFSYILIDQQIYSLNKEKSKLLKLLYLKNKKKILFKEEEFGKFANVILPKIKKIDENIKLPETIEKQFSFNQPKLKYCFDKTKDNIIGEIKLEIDENDINIFTKEEKINGKYIIRDQELEEKYINELIELGFVYNQDKQNFKLEQEESFIYFLEKGLKKLTEKYEVYVSKKLKDIKVYSKGNVRSSFGIGKDNILSYEFSIENVDSKEIQNLLDAVKLKKKYYRLKNGDFMHIENDAELEKFQNIVDSLELTGKDLQNEKVQLPKYKSIQISNFKEEENSEFIQMNDNLNDLINKFREYKNTKIKLPAEDKKILRDYQETGVKWMMTIANCGFGGILADEMGLGKSLQTIEYIKLKLKQNEKAKFLIVVPTSLVYNWQKEFEKFAPTIPICLIHDIKTKRIEKIKEMNNYSVIITSYGLLRQDLDEYQKINFDTCIIDEAQNIKNVQTEITKAVKTVNADIKFALTGTPIENSILELWSIFDYIMPGFLSNFTKFKRNYSVKKMDEDPNILKDLNNLISPFILRRKKMDVIKDLPAKLENTVMIELEEEQKKLYVAQLQKTKQQIEETIEKEGFLKSQILILSLLTKLRQICIDPRLLIEEYQGGSAKIKQLIEIIKGSTLNGHKILVFSQFPSALQLIKPYLELENLTYSYLDGSTKSKLRMQLVEEFNQNDTNVFLISLKAGGTGLNLTSADIVIHLDPWWNPQVENQATDRAHRIGQKNVVEVVKLVAKGTIEEKIVQLQAKKKLLSDQVIEGEDRDKILLSKLTEKELRSLLDS